MEEFESNLSADTMEISFGVNGETRFKVLLLNIYKCYELMIKDELLLPNLENDIRDILLLNYLNNNEIRHTLNFSNFLFDPEVPENSGRSDIKVQTYDTFQDTKAYFIIECKRLDGCAYLNKEYVKNGVNRFTTSYYTSYYKLNAMIGFVVKDIDIDENMNKIGSFFNTIENNRLYDSNHISLKLYHLMMDFSKNIEVKKYEFT